MKRRVTPAVAKKEGSSWSGGQDMHRQQCKLHVKSPPPHLDLRSPMRHKRGELSFCHLTRGSNKQVDQG